jgi:putative DNA primase/helicase
MSLTLSRAAPYATATVLLHKHWSRAKRRLIHYRGNFYQWTGSYYRQADDKEIRAEVYRFLNAASAYGDKGQPEPFCPNMRAVNEVLDALKSQILISGDVPAPAWLAGPSRPSATEILPCRNGLLCLRTGELPRHTPDFLGMNALDFDYSPKAAAPQWERFLEEILPSDPEAIATLQEIAGYLLTADVSQQKIFMLVGASRSGKGTVARVLRALLGHANVVGPTLSSLKDQFGMQPLINKRAAIISDARLDGHNQHEIVERLLTISGEDAISVPRKNIEAWNGTLGVRFVMLSNELPRFTDASGVIASRFILVRMRQSFYGREDHQLTEKLLAELPGVLNWAIAGLKRLRERGHFDQPASSKEAIDTLESLASPVRAFVKECCVVDPEREVPCDDLWDAWKAWCEENGHHVGSKTAFWAKLNAAVPTVERGRRGSRGVQRWHYLGIGFTEAYQNEEQEMAKILHMIEHVPPTPTVVRL